MKSNQINLMDDTIEDSKRLVLSKTTLHLSNLLRNDMRVGRIKHFLDIETFIKPIPRSLYPRNEHSILDIYKYSSKDNQSDINDLITNYHLAADYLLTFKEIVDNECNKLIKNALEKQEKIQVMQKMKIKNKYLRKKTSEKETQIENDCLKRIMFLPEDVIQLISSYAITPTIRIELIKSKYDNVLFDNLNKMNLKMLNIFLKKYIEMNKKCRRDLSRKFINQDNTHILDLLDEYNITLSDKVDYSLKKTLKINYIIDGLKDKYDAIELLFNMKKIKIPNHLLKNLIHCYHSCLYVSNKVAEQKVIKKKVQSVAVSVHDM